MVIEPTTVTLPGGARIRGRGRRQIAEPVEFTLRLTSRRVVGAAQSVRTVAWPDFGVPRDDEDAIAAIRELVARAEAGQRVEVVCDGGTGRTGTVIAAAAILGGMGAADAIAWVRTHYRPSAIETRGQRRWLERLAAGLG